MKKCIIPMFLFAATPASADALIKDPSQIKSLKVEKVSISCHLFTNLLTARPALLTLTAAPPAKAEKAVCADSDAYLIARQNIGFKIVLKRDFEIPSNAAEVALNEDCHAELRERWAQKGILKAR